MRRLVFFASLISQFFAVTAPAAVEVIDDRGVVLRRDSPAQRVIALAPHLTELVFAASAGNRLVGKVRGSGNRIADVERLERLGFAVLVLEPRRLEDIPRRLRMLGVLLGTGVHAQAAVLAFVSRADRLRERYRGRSAVSVLFQAWHQPLITVNGEHLISDVLRLCGERNAFADLPQLATVVSPEQVLAADPDAIIIGSEAEDAGSQGWQRYPYLKSVRRGAIFTVPADLITRQTPRVLDAAEKICADLDAVRYRSPTSPRPSPP